MNAHLILSDGTHYEGRLLGAPGETVGEAVFNTGMTGYQEIFSDPSYAGQIVVFTYPMIGNYGINDDDFESRQIQTQGIVVRESCPRPSNWRSTKTVHTLLEEKGITGIEGVDTRSLTKKIRSAGVTMAIITTTPEGALERLGGVPAYGDSDYVYKVTAQEPYAWGYSGQEGIDQQEGEYKYTVAVLDCGLKYNILRRFASLGCRTLVYPASSSAEEVLSRNPDGVLLSPGPGDPARLEPVVQTIRELLGKKPMFGICLGNQLLCQAVGGHTFKLKFGHRGSNHPVKDLLDGSVTITAQNHGYAVNPESLAGTGATVTQLNINDGTVEGIQVKEAGASSIQYHPEAAPGPWDSRKYFMQFLRQIQEFQS